MAVLKLVKPAISHELVKLLRDLTAAAERGDIDGALVSCCYPGPDDDFALYVAGSARQHISRTRGTLNQLDLELAKFTK